MQTSRFDPTIQFPFLLPTNKQIRAVEKRAGMRNDARLRNAIYLTMGKLTRKPDDPELWMELAYEFNIDPNISWPLFYAAYRIAPQNPRYIDALAWCLQAMGLSQEAIKLVDDSIAGLTPGSSEHSELCFIKEELRLQSDILLNVPVRCFQF